MEGPIYCRPQKIQPFFRFRGNMKPKNFDRFLLPVAGTLAGLLLVALVVTLISLPRGTAGPAAPQMVPTAGVAGAVPAITLPPTWTPPPPPTPFPTRTPTHLPTVDITQTVASQTLRMMMDFESADTQGGQPAASQTIAELDLAVIARQNDPDAYFQRGRAYEQLAAASMIESVYVEDLTQGLRDLDKAINLNSTRGEYFEYRGFIYWDQAKIAKYRVDRDRLLKIALDNMQIAARLTPHGIGAQTNVLSLMGELGQCQEALDLEQKLEKSGAYSPDQVLNFNYHMARLDLCAGKYAEALVNVDKAIQLNGINCDSSQARAIILYNAGRKDEALAAMDTCLKTWPYWRGERYYWRALMNYDRGQKDPVPQDLETGARNTWSREGIYAYIQARQALDGGDRKHGIELLQYAEASMNIYADGPALLEKVRKELAVLGVVPLSPTPDGSLLRVTPMPTTFPRIPTKKP